jgi:hypothetical protein
MPVIHFLLFASVKRYAQSIIRIRESRAKGRADMSVDISDAIKAAEKARCAAMLANDNTALSSLLDPRLQFHHATGAVDDKDAYMAKMAAGRIEYVGITWSEKKVIALGDTAAVLTGRMNTDVRVEGIEKALVNRVTAVWGLNKGVWQMLVFQSTPMAA